MEVAAVNVAIKKGAEETTTTMGDANDDDTIENPQNFYSYCITCIERDGACSMRGIRKITQLVIFQFLVMFMAYAFYDDSVLSLMLADRSAFKDPMPRQTFYYREDDGISLIGGHSTVGTVCGIAACLFLALTIKGDDAESLLTLPVKTMPLTNYTQTIVFRPDPINYFNGGVCACFLCGTTFLAYPFFLLLVLMLPISPNGQLLVGTMRPVAFFRFFGHW